MTRKTSVNAYRQITEEGMLSRLRQEVYDVLYHHGPMTAQELGAHMQRDGVWKRLPELKELGVIEEVGERECHVTGRRVIEWDVTGELPKQIERKKTNAERVRELEAENNELRRLLSAFQTPRPRRERQAAMAQQPTLFAL